jgi:RNA polymerase sigma factor (sigma-70 family)
MIRDSAEEMSTLNTQPDTELLRRFVQSQEETAFAALVQRHGALVLGVCRRVLQHTQDTEDAFQASFLVLARKASSIQSYQSVAGWLYKVAYRIALRARASRSQRQRRESQLLVDLSRTGADHRQNHVDLLVEEEVQRLPEKYRTPVLLCYLQGQTNEEAARQLRCPTNTVKIRLLRGREMLRKRLSRQGVGLALAAGLFSAGFPLQAAVAPALLEATTIAGCGLRSGLGLAQLALPARVIRLAQTWFKRIALAKIKIASAVLITVLLLVLADYLSQKAFGAQAAVAPPTRPVDIAPLPTYPDYLVPERSPEEFVMDHSPALEG